MANMVVMASVVLLVGLLAKAEDADIVLADFEGRDYGEWKTSGDAFGTGPARGTLPGQMGGTGAVVERGSVTPVGGVLGRNRIPRAIEEIES
jgi:hypothetical protein